MILETSLPPAGPQKPWLLGLLSSATLGKEDTALGSGWGMAQAVSLVDPKVPEGIAVAPPREVQWHSDTIKCNIVAQH